MKNISDPERLRALLGTPALSRIRARLRSRLRRAGELRGMLTIDEARSDERAAIDALFGRKPTSGKLTIRLEDLERILRNAGIAGSLVDAVEALEGPVVAERQALLAGEAAWSELHSTILATATGERAWIRGWCDEIVATGLLRRVSHGDHEDARRLFGQALALLRRSPFSGVRIAQLAADSCGDSHALDDGEPLGTVVVRGFERELDVVGGDVSRREVLARMGIVADDLSAPVLVLNLRPASSGLLSATLHRYADAGEPLHVSLGQMQREDLEFAGLSEGAVYVCENPTVLAAAADALGPSCRPLICVSGQVRSAARDLLGRLRRAGVRVMYHGDFDWPGILIARGLFGRDEAEPWRMRAADYLAAAVGPPLEGGAVPTPWDEALSEEMMARGRAVHEEAVLGLLLDDLRAEPSR